MEYSIKKNSSFGAEFVGVTGLESRNCAICDCNSYEDARKSNKSLI